jgi:ribosomal protein S18 acetylase RimI-like enzyme
MSQITVRLATIEDIEAVAGLFNKYRQFYAQEDNLQVAIEFIRNRIEKQDAVILVAQNPMQEIIGFCQLYPTFCSVIAAPIYILYDLFVEPRSRKTGAGRLLMLAAHEHAKNNGFARLDLTTAKDNVVAQNLYESLGWVRDEVFYAYSKVA